MFAEAGKYEPCGIFTIGHFSLLAVTIAGIYFALEKTINKSKAEVYKIIKKVTIIAWILEIIKIIFNISKNSIKAVNTYVPLYYCSVLLYAGLLSFFAKGKLKRAGDVTLATATVIGGASFLIYPSTSLPTYPVFHFISLHSFFYHGMMVYIGILLNATKYVELRLGDVKYVASIIISMSIAALIINKIFDANLMFISKNFPGTPVAFIYKITKGTFMFSILMVLNQAFGPFYITYYLLKLIEKIKKFHNYLNPGSTNFDNNHHTSNAKFVEKI